MAKISSYVENAEINKIENVDILHADNRTDSELREDYAVKWFDGVACVNMTIDQAFLQKDLTKVRINGLALSEYVKNILKPGDKVQLTFDHVEILATYKIMVIMTKTREGKKGFPIIMNFEFVRQDKMNS